MEVDGTKAAELAEVSVEAREPFGDEESYWTVYRMFVAGKNLGRFWTIEEIWWHLAKSYDMSQETMVSLEETLLQWEGDIIEDALNRAGIAGFLVNEDGHYIFAERWRPSMAQELGERIRARNAATARVALRETIQQKPTSADTVEQVVTPLTDPEQIIAVAFSSDESEVKQTVIKQALVEGGHGDSMDDPRVQAIIDTLVNQGRLYKQRRGVVYLSLTPMDTMASPTSKERPKRKEEVFEAILATDILGALCAPGTHYSQRVTMSQLWRRMHEHASKSEAVPPEELDALKKTCRQLQMLNYVHVGSEKMGTGGGTRSGSATSSTRRRSASQHVYKVGLISQQVKGEVQDLLSNPDVSSYLQMRFEEKSAS